jgi:hypothetical protein
MAAQHTQHFPPSGAKSAAGQSNPQPNPQQSRSGGSATGGPAGEVKENARQAGEQIKDSAQAAVEGFRQQGEGFISDQKARAANELTTLSTAVRSAAEKLRDEQGAGAARYVEMAADRLEGAARYIGDSDVRSLVRQVEQAARRRPELFLGGMFLLGLGVSRFLKSSSRSENDRDWRTMGSP